MVSVSMQSQVDKSTNIKEKIHFKFTFIRLGYYLFLLGWVLRSKHTQLLENLSPSVSLTHFAEHLSSAIAFSRLLLSAWHQLLLNWSHTEASDKQPTHGNVRLAGSQPTESSHPWWACGVAAEGIRWCHLYKPTDHVVRVKTWGREGRNS